jgi:hypothetical protein
VHDLDVFSASGRPPEAYAELIVDTNTMLARAISSQRLNSITGWYPQIFQACSDLELPKLTSRNGCDVRKSLCPFAL